MEQRILRLPETIETTGYSKATIYRLMKEGLFPKQRKMGPKAVGWLASDIKSWLDGLKVAA